MNLAEELKDIQPFEKIEKGLSAIAESHDFDSGYCPKVWIKEIRNDEPELPGEVSFTLLGFEVKWLSRKCFRVEINLYCSDNPPYGDSVIKAMVTSKFASLFHSDGAHYGRIFQATIDGDDMLLSRFLTYYMKLFGYASDSDYCLAYTKGILPKRVLRPANLAPISIIEERIIDFFNKNTDGNFVFNIIPGKECYSFNYLDSDIDYGEEEDDDDSDDYEDNSDYIQISLRSSTFFSNEMKLSLRISLPKLQIMDSGESLFSYFLRSDYSSVFYVQRCDDTFDEYKYVSDEMYFYSQIHLGRNLADAIGLISYYIRYFDCVNNLVFEEN